VIAMVFIAPAHAELRFRFSVRHRIYDLYKYIYDCYRAE